MSAAKVIVKPPYEKPYVGTVGHFKDLQALVGGYFEMHRFGNELDLFVNEEGRLKNLPPQEPGPFEGWLGVVVLARHDSNGEMIDMTQAEIDRYLEAFWG